MEALSLFRDVVKPKERVCVPIAWKLYFWMTKWSPKIKKGTKQMAIHKEVQELVRSHVNNRISSYHQLREEDQRQLIATIIRNMSKYEKAAILSDADLNEKLPDLVANLIERQSFRNVTKFIDTLVNVFLHGENNKRSYFFYDINDCFNEEWSRRWPVESEPYQIDMQRRIREARSL